jgi:hypothetical protein
MACTDAALSWLLSLSATCSSSPLRPSSPPHSDLTDWLQISPSPPRPLQDVSSSSRLNVSHAFPDLDDPLSDPMFSLTSSQSMSFFQSPSADQHYPPMFSSPLINDLTISPFRSYLNFYDPSVALPPLSFSDVSPVVRASRNPEEPDLEPQVSKKKSRLRDSRKPASSFLEKLQAPAPSRPLSMPGHLPANLALLDASSASHPLLLSPVKLPSPPPALSHVISDTIPAPVFTPAPRPSRTANASLSPLSPLTPLSSPTNPEPDHLPSLKIKIVLKRKNTNPTTPVRRTKRLCPARTPQQNDEAPPESSDNKPEPSEDDNSRPIYTNRMLPADIEISSAFPLLYRRFPASMYYQPQDAV